MSTQYQLDWTQKRPPAVQAAIADGMQRSDDHADHFWKRIVDGAILAAARRLPELTVDDVLDELEKVPNCPSTHDLSALGPAMQRARRDKVLRPTDRVIRSRRPGKHGNRHNVWASNYFSAAVSGSARKTG